MKIRARLGQLVVGAMLAGVGAFPAVGRRQRPKKAEARRVVQVRHDQTDLDESYLPLCEEFRCVPVECW